MPVVLRFEIILKKYKKTVLLAFQTQVAQWIKRLPSKQKIEGSTPFLGAFFIVTF